MKFHRIQAATAKRPSLSHPFTTYPLPGEGKTRFHPRNQDGSLNHSQNHDQIPLIAHRPIPNNHPIKPTTARLAPPSVINLNSLKLSFNFDLHLHLHLNLSPTSPTLPNSTSQPQ